MRALLLAVLCASNAQAVELVCRTMVTDSAGNYEAIFEARFQFEAVEFGDDGVTPWVAVTLHGERDRRDMGENESCKFEAPVPIQPDE